MNIIRERRGVGCGERIWKLLPKENIVEILTTMHKLSAFILQLIPQTAIRSCGSYVTLYETKIISRMSLTIQ